MSYDVIVIETVGEVSKEYKFKDYRDFLDWELQGKAANKDCTNLFTKKELPEDEEEFIRLTKNNVTGLVKVGDTVVVKCCASGTREDAVVVEMEELDYDGVLPFKLNNYYGWIDCRDDQFEIYKVIKN